MKQCTFKRNFHWATLTIAWGVHPPRAMTPPPFLPHPPSSPFLPSLFPSLPPLPLEIGPLKSSYGPGEHCELPQRGLGRSPSRNRIWCILALKIVKYKIWWKQF